MKNQWKWIVAVAVAAAAIAGAATAIVVYRAQVLSLLNTGKDAALSKVMQAKEKLCCKKACYTPDELKDFADV